MVPIPQGARSLPAAPVSGQNQEHVVATFTCQDSTFDNLASIPALSSATTTRQLQLSARKYPQRKDKHREGTKLLRPSTIDSFITGIWKQIYSGVEVYSNPMVGDIIASFTEIALTIELLEQPL